jgi:hypothetical protein
MDLLQRYTEENNEYIIQDEFEESLQSFPFDVVPDIIQQIGNNFSKLPMKDFIIQKVCGLSHAHTEPFYFLIQYMKTKNETNYLLNIEQVDSDTFLDHIIKKKNFNYERDSI